MKALRIFYIAAGVASGLALTSWSQPADNPNAAPVANNATQPAPDKPGENNSEKGLRLNFRGVPLDMVLNYLSDAAGFILVLETEVKGKVDVWSNQPLNKDEAVELLNSVLNKNGYAALRNGRTLTIISREEAKRRNIPVKSGSNPDAIPKNDEIITQIIPVRYINATQLTRDLQPLLPEKATLTANEGGNALVVTDSQANIRRLAEIVQALDTAIASISTVRVFPLKYADAKTLANVIKEVFQTPETSRNDLRAQILNRFRGGGGPFGGDGGGGGNRANTESNEGRPGASRVTAVADERTNALVVSAPEELIPTIEEVVNTVDAPVEDVTELRVFRLKFSDPVEVADLLTGLFPDDTRTDQGRAQVQFGGGPFGPFGGGRRNANADSDQSERTKKQGRVIAVPDRRTSSVVVSASRDLMTQIGEMIAQIDANPAKKQKVFIYSLENADVQNVEEILRGLFESDTSRRTTGSSTRQTSNPLNTRTTGNQNTGGNLGNNFGNNNGLGGGGNQINR